MGSNRNVDWDDGFERLLVAGGRAGIGKLWPRDELGTRFVSAYGVTYGGASLSGKALPTTNPKKITALSYDLLPNQFGPSGGSPRMVVCFDDAANCSSNADLGPNTWSSPATWTTVDGFTPADSNQDNVWVNNGGTCGSLYDTTWSNIVACHPLPTKITEVFVVNDSGWEYPDGSEQVTLDNLDVNGLIATGP